MNNFTKPKFIIFFVAILIATLTMRYLPIRDAFATPAPLYLPLVSKDEVVRISQTHQYTFPLAIRGMVQQSSKPLFISSSGLILDEDRNIFINLSPIHPEQININHAIYHEAFFLVFYNVVRDGQYFLYIDRFTHQAEEINLASRREIFTYQIDVNTSHHGGAMAIDERGYLYFSLGDGAPQGDPEKLSREPRLMNGAILRIDPFTLNGRSPDCGSGNYGIPIENEINKPAGRCGEVLFSGLRHAWRFSLNEDLLIIGDVGQSSFEEINVTPIDGHVDFGWSCFEGNQQLFECDTDHVTPPTHVYAHFQDGLPLCAVVGAEQLAGSILFVDHCSNSIYKIEGSVITEVAKFAEGGLVPTSFERWNDKLYVTTLDGIVFEWEY